MFNYSNRSTMKERLLLLIENLKVSRAAFERACGLSNGYVNNIKGNIGAKALEGILRAYPSVNRDWLLYGEGSMLTPSPVTVTQSNVHGNNTYAGGNVVHGANALAAVGRDTAYCNRCGSTDVYYTCPAPKGAPVVPVTLNSAPGIDLLEYVRTHASVEQSNITVGGLRIDMFMFVRDASLEPRYCIGDLIALIAYPKGEENPIPGKIYAVDTYSNGLHLRILRNDDPRLEEGDYLARSFNPDKYPDYIIRKKDIIRIFKKVFIVKF